MKRMRQDRGFTLVEMLVTIIACTLVLGAASSALLLAMRMNRIGTQTASRRQNAQIVMSMIENLAAEGAVDVSDEGHSIVKADNPNVVYVQWDGENRTLLVNGAAVLEHVEDFFVRPHGGHSNLLDLTVKIRDAISGECFEYTTTVYSRGHAFTGTVAEPPPLTASGDAPESAGRVPTLLRALALFGSGRTKAERLARQALLETLLSQEGSEGEILGGDGAYRWYSEWYIDGYRNGWTPQTPWCACFLSWGAAQLPEDAFAGDAPRFANVDTGMAGFRAAGRWADADGEYLPLPGDYVFFDWFWGDDPAHVAAVLCACGDTLYTVEGNSEGVAAVRQYRLDDPAILGYGLLNWKE